MKPENIPHHVSILANDPPEARRIIESAEKQIFSGRLSDIIEVTYAYSKLADGKRYNRTLFSEFSGTPQEAGIATAFETTGKKLEEMQVLVQRHLDEATSLGLGKSGRLDVLVGSLEYTQKILKITQIGLPFEAEKAGMELTLSRFEIEERVSRIEELEGDLFGGNMRDDAAERVDSLEKIRDGFIRDESRLTQEEREEFFYLFESIGGNTKDLQASKKNEKISDKDETKIDWKERLIKRKDYMEIFRKVLSIYGIQKPVVCNERSSIYDGEDVLNIPNSEGYNTLPLSRVLSLIQHEIETHYIIQSNNDLVLGKFRGAKNLEREEGLAIISEGLLKGNNIESFAQVRTNPSIYAGEILDGAKLERFMYLQAKIGGDADPDVSGMLLRRKRNYPMGYRGVQHKDVTYARGEKRVAEYILNGGHIHDLYIAKVSFEDIATVKALAENEKIPLKYPLLIGELLTGSMEGKRITEKDFRSVIIEKYPFLQEFMSDCDGVAFGTKRKIAEILQLIRS